MKRRISPIVARYTAGNFLLPFACAILGFAALFLLHNFLDDISDFKKTALPAATVIRYFLLKQPENLTNVIPISVLLAASFMTLMMGRHNELTAMRAAGLSLASCMLPVWCFAFAASLTVFAINESWGPACAKQAAEIHAKRKPTVSFHHPSALRDWSFTALSSDGTGEELVLRQAPRGADTGFLLVAKRARYQNGLWLFENGFLQTESGNAEKTHQVFQEKTMDFPETPSDILAHSRNWELATIRELLAMLRSGIIVSPRSRALLRTLVWYRLFFPLAALIGALFGVSLTIATDRMGLMKGFASAVFLLVFYYLVAQLFLVLGKNGSLPAFLAGAFPSIAFLAAATITAWRKQ